MIFIDPPFQFDLPPLLYWASFKITYLLYLGVFYTLGREIVFTPEFVAFAIGLTILGSVALSVGNDLRHLRRLKRNFIARYVQTTTFEGSQAMRQ
jgi:hypothetical protein